METTTKSPPPIRQPMKPTQKPIIERVHAFSPKLARFGYKAALLLGYIANRIKNSKNVRDGKIWFYYTVAEFAEQFPYLKRSTIADILERLTRSPNLVLIRNNYNKRPADKTCWYAFAKNDDYQEALSKVKRIKFEVKHAVLFEDVLAAVIVSHIAYWVRFNRKKAPDYEWHRFAANDYAKRVPFGRGKINRSLKNLVDAGVLESKPCGGTDHASFFRFKDAKYLDGAYSDIDGPNPDIDSTFPDIDGSKPDIDGSFPDDVTSWKTPVQRHQLEDIRFEDNNYKETRPPAESGVFVLSLRETKIQSENVSTTSVLSMPAAGENLENSQKQDSAKYGRKGNIVEFLRPKSSGPPTPSEHVPFSIRAADSEGLDFGAICSLLQHWEGQFPRPASENGLTILNYFAREIVNEVIEGLSAETLAEVSTTTANEVLGILRPLIASVIKTANKHGEHTKRFLTVLCGRRCVDVILHPNSLEGDWRVIAGKVFGRIKQVLDARKPAAKEAEQARQYAAKQELAATLEADYQARLVKYRSRDVESEPDATLGAAQKVNIMKNGVRSLINIGHNTGNMWYTEPIIYTDSSWKLAKAFFEVNPGVSVGHLLSVLRSCSQYWDSEGGEGAFDPNYHMKTSKHLTTFFKNLDRIVTTLGMTDELPPLNHPDYGGKKE